MSEDEFKDATTGTADELMEYLAWVVVIVALLATFCGGLGVGWLIWS